MVNRRVAWNVIGVAALLVLLPIIGWAVRSLWLMLAAYCLAACVGLIWGALHRNWAAVVGGLLALTAPVAFVLVDWIWHHVPPLFLEGAIFVASPIGVALVVVHLWLGAQRRSP